MLKFFSELKRLVLSPFESLSGTLEFYNAWFGSRRWRAILIGMPLLLIAFGLLIYASISGVAGQQGRARAFVEQIDQVEPLEQLERVLYREEVKLDGLPPSEIEALRLQGGNKEAAVLENPKLPRNSSATLTDSTKSTLPAERPDAKELQRMELALQRVIEIDDGSDDARYRLAVIYALQGHRQRADKLINELATNGKIPNLAAYHWQAVNLINRRVKGELVPQPELIRILDKASAWRDALPEIRFAQADVMFEEGKIDRGLDLALATAKIVPDRMLAVALRARQNNRERIFTEASTTAERFYQTRHTANPASFADTIGYADALLLLDRKETAMELLRSQIDNSSQPEPQLRAALAGIYMTQFQFFEQQRMADEKLRDRQPSLKLLEEAGKVDPTNQQLGRYIAVLLAGGKIAISQPLKDTLSKQVAQNAASAETLMILGGLYYQQDRREQAEAYWVKVVEAQPNAVTALNNLALLQIEREDPKPAKGLEYIERAFALDPNNVEVCDSYGQILLALDRTPEAIAMLERALRQKNDRPNTRKMLVEAYNKLGNKRISAAYEKLVSKVVPSAADDTAVEQKPDATQNQDKPKVVDERDEPSIIEDATK